MAIASKDLGILALRIAAGAVIAGHGYTKLFGGEDKETPAILNRIYGKNFADAVKAGGMSGFVGALKHMKYPAPTAGAYAAAISEFGGGIAMVAGLGGPLPAAAVAATMLGAVNAHKATGLYGQGGAEFAMVLGAAAGALAIVGPGRYSLDSKLGK